MHAMPGTQSPEEGWNSLEWGYRELGGAMGVLDIKPGPCGRAASTLEWTISPAPFI